MEASTYTPGYDELEAQSDMAAAPSGDPTEQDVPTFLGFPLERILTIGRPAINVAAATTATWLEAHVHLLSLFHTSHQAVVGAITQLVIWLATALFTDRALAQWVDNLIKHRATKAGLHAAIVTALETKPAVEVSGGDYSPRENQAAAPLTAEEVAAYDAEHTTDPEADAAPADGEDAAPPQGE